MQRQIIACRPLLLLLALLLAGCSTAQQTVGIAERLGDPSPQPTERPPITATVKQQAHTGKESALSLATVTPQTTPTPVPALTATAPQPTVTGTPTPDPLPRLFQLATGGCCTQPFWGPDSQEVRFIDRPADNAPTGIWAIPVTQPGTDPLQITDQIRASVQVGSLRVESAGVVTTIENLADGSRWEVPTGGEIPSIAPDQSRMVWEVQNHDLPWDERVAEIWVAAIDGSGAQHVLTLPRGRVVGWITNDLLLLSGDEGDHERLLTLSLSDNTTTDLVREEDLRGTALSPDGSWVAYLILHNSEPEKNGLWVARTDGTAHYKLPAEFFGAYQWRDEHRLLLVPFRPNATFHELWEFDIEHNDARRLTDPDRLPFKIANGDWTVSPDGQYVAFVESRDHNIWVIELN